MVKTVDFLVRIDNVIIIIWSGRQRFFTAIQISVEGLKRLVFLVGGDKVE